MRTERKWFLLIAAGVLLKPGWMSPQVKQPQRQEQTEFSAEDEAVHNPVPLPADVLQILARDQMVINQIKYDENAQGELQPSWFSASVVHLRHPNEKDLVVQAVGPLAGANVDMFWVFVASQSGYQLVLAAPAHDLEVKQQRWTGFRDIEMSGETAMEFTSVGFRWDGTRYTKFREKSERLP